MDCVETEVVKGLSKPRDVVGVMGLVVVLEIEMGEARSF